MWKDDPRQLCHTGHMWLLAISNISSNSNIALRRTKVQSVTRCVHCTVLYTTVNTQTTQYTEAAGSQSIPVNTTPARGGTNARCGGQAYTRRSENKVFHPSEFTLGSFVLFLAILGTAFLAMNNFLNHFCNNKWEK